MLFSLLFVFDKIMNIKILYAWFLVTRNILYNFLPFERRAKPCHAEICRAWESSRACFLSLAFNRARRLHTSPKLIPGSAIYVDTYAYIRLTSTNDTRHARTHMHNKHNAHPQIYISCYIDLVILGLIRIIYLKSFSLCVI